MFKMILSAVVALGLGSVAYAAEGGHTTGATTDTMNKEMPATDNMNGATDKMKKEHKDHAAKGKMAEGQMKKMKKGQKGETTEQTN